MNPWPLSHASMALDIVLVVLHTLTLGMWYVADIIAPEDAGWAFLLNFLTFYIVSQLKVPSHSWPENTRSSDHNCIVPGDTHTHTMVP